MKTAEQIEDAVREAGERMKPKVEEAKRQLSSWSEKLTVTIKENPVPCLVGAVALGFVIGKLARRA
jgi:hypothetical protein